MPRPGGQATTTGIDFQTWVFALKFADAFFDDTLKVKPEAFIHSAIVMSNAFVMKDIVLESPYDKFKIPVLSKQGLLEFIHNQEKISGDKVKEVVKVIENYYKDLTEEGFNTNND